MFNIHIPIFLFVYFLETVHSLGNKLLLLLTQLPPGDWETENIWGGVNWEDAVFAR